MEVDVLEDYDIILDQQEMQSHNSSTQKNPSYIEEKQLKVTPVPNGNCPEKIIICLDLNEEMETTEFNTRAGNKLSSLDVAKKCIRMFVMNKNQMNPNHEFSLVTFDKEAIMVHQPTKKHMKLLNILDSSDVVTQRTEPLDLSTLFETVHEHVDLPPFSEDCETSPPPYTVRLVLFYGRSHSIPVGGQSRFQLELESSPYFFTDVVYIHQPLSQLPDNQCEEIFKSLCNLDHCGLSYIFDESSYTKILNCGAKLLAHPLQRPSQSEAKYKIGSAIDEKQR